VIPLLGVTKNEAENEEYIVMSFYKAGTLDD
jgi:hypothetical protein